MTSGNGAPDVFGLEDAFVRKYVESALLLEADDIYLQVKDKMVDYPMKVGTHNGHVYGQAKQVTISGHSGLPWMAYIAGHPSVYGGVFFIWLGRGLPQYTAPVRPPGGHYMELDVDRWRWMGDR